jgi:6-pyruvoyltetrahydropterin/6-carboxytetrahydropterin synthase
VKETEVPFEITTEETFAAAHYIEGYQGNCSKLHGHNWRVRVTLRADKPEPIGLTYDFRKLRAVLKDVIAVLDHSVLNELPIFRSMNPTAETIAGWCFEELSGRIMERGVVVSRVEIWESDRSCAAFVRE